MSVSVPPGKQTFLDPETGALLSLGTVTHYVPSTTTFKNTWADEGQTEVNTNPITLDATGSCSIWGDGLYRQIVRDAAGNLIWDIVTGLPASPTLAIADGGTGATTAAGAVAAIGADPAATLFGRNTQTASYTLVLGDAGQTIEMDVAGANNLTIPLNATVAFPTDTKINVVQIGAGQTTILATSGVTILSYMSYVKMSAQYVDVRLYKRATDTWVLTGSLTS